MATTDKPTFSIIIPTYNRAEALRHCLDSIEKQVFRDFEVLVCDDGSKDHTKEVVAFFENAGMNIRYFFNENWGGPAFPRNIGIANARAEWVCFLDSDDSWLPRKLERCAAYINDVDFICHSFNITDGHVIKGKMTTIPLDKDPFIRLMTRGNSIITSSVCVKKEVVQSLNGFPEDKTLVAVEDFDLWLRIARAGYKMKVLDDCLGYYLEHDSNISYDADKQIGRLRNIYGKFMPFLNASQRRRSIGILDYHIAVLEGKMDRTAAANKYYRSALMKGWIVVKVKAFLRLLYAMFKVKG